MDPREIFLQYRRERRAQTYVGYELQVLPHLTRHVPVIDGADGFVSFADLSSENVRAAIHEQIAYFDRRGQSFEWKVYDFDSPGNLRTLLASLGFRPNDEEAFMVVDQNVGNRPLTSLPASRSRRSWMCGNCGTSWP